jgi:hypothetical protein
MLAFAPRRKKKAMSTRVDILQQSHTKEFISLVLPAYFGAAS